MADGSPVALAVLRFLVFATLAVAAPGVALQRLARVRWEPALVLPLGLAWCSLAYWLALVSGQAWLFLVLILPALVLAAWPGLPARRAGPSLRGAAVPVALLLALFALTQYPTNRVDRSGAFRLDLGEHVDTALHVGVSFELVAGYPPEVPGLAGVPMHYHVGSHLVRAAAARWAGIHPYDAISRFDVTLWAIALVLALRALVQAVGLGRPALALAGFAPLACDLSFVPGLAYGAEWWAFKLGGNFVEPLFYANAITPALAMALAALLALACAERGEGEGFTVLATALTVAAAFFKVFTGAQLLLALAAAAALGRARRRLLLVLLPAAVALVVLALRSASPAGAAGVTVRLLPFPLVPPALEAFSLPAPGAAARAAWAVPWLVLSLGLRAVGIGPALEMLRGGRAGGRALAALALSGWPLGSLLSITADPRYEEGFYFLQASGVLLWLFAVPALQRLAAGASRRPWRMLALGAAAVLAFGSTAEFVARRALQRPQLVAPSAVRAMVALRRASRPGQVVLTRPLPRGQWVPLPVVLAGRRVVYSNYLGYWGQFVSAEALERRDRMVRSFFRAQDPDSARRIASELGADFAYLTGAQHVDFEPAGVLEPVFEEEGERVYRIVRTSRR